MKAIISFFKLIRSVNLLFIIITQLLLYYAIIVPTLAAFGLQPVIQQHNLLLIIIASVTIAAAGNIINDYFDINIDQINKPQKLIVNKIISRRWVIFWHLLLSVVGIMCSMYVAFKTGVWFIGIVNAATVMLLFIYSASLKKRFLIGNIVVSALTAWVLLVLIVPECHIGFTHKINVTAYNKLFRLGIVYAGFSFIISLIREAVKDVEDMDGDEKYNCKTLPIVLGIPATKVYVSVWVLILLAAVTVLQIYVLPYGWWYSIIWCAATVITPLIFIQKQIIAAQNTQHYAKISQYVKYVMLAGILSMLFLSLK